jgi:subtilisin family serine protease
MVILPAFAAGSDSIAPDAGSPAPASIAREGSMRKRFGAAIAAITLLTVLMPTAYAGNDFATATSTSGGYQTWDSDMVNIEGVTQTGAGVYVAVLDTGLTPDWKSYFPTERIATQYGTGFDQAVTFKARLDDPCVLDAEIAHGSVKQSTYIGSRGSTHGTHVASTIIGYNYYSNTDAYSGFVLPPIQVRGIAPDATIIPVKVLADYQVPALPKCADPALQKQKNVVFGTDEMVAAGINYVTSLKNGPLHDSPVVINMSLGGSLFADAEKDAIDAAITAGVIVVAAAGNEDESGMSYPGAYAPVISAGSVGWTGEWLVPGVTPPAGFVRYRMWWLQNTSGNPGTAGTLTALLANTGQVADPTNINDVYLSDFSSRALPGQQLDVLAPGSWVRGPFAGDPGYNHLPWWSSGIGNLVGRNSGNFYYVGGTSMATPHVASIAALMLQKNPSLKQADVDSRMKSTALALPSTGTRQVWDPFNAAGPAVYPVPWDTSCDGGSGTVTCDPVGAGLIQADAAVAAS